MKINDDVFGEIEYDYGWSREINIVFMGNNVDISLVINGDEDGVFEEEQYEAYNALMEKWNSLQKQIVEKILLYYIAKRNELGYDNEYNEKYPLIESKEQLLQNIELAGIVIPYSGVYDGRESGLAFDCTWDSENGIGVCLVDEKVIEVGYQDIVF